MERANTGRLPASRIFYILNRPTNAASANAQHQMDLRVAVIGHTHHTRIAVREDADGGSSRWIDCGAWIEDCIAEGDDGPSPNVQIGALSANEARIPTVAVVIAVVAYKVGTGLADPEYEQLRYVEPTPQKDSAVLNFPPATVGQQSRGVDRPFCNPFQF